MSDLEKMRYFLGIEVLQTEEEIFIFHNKYAKEVLERFGMERSKSIHNQWFLETSCPRKEVEKLWIQQSTSK